MKQANKNFTTNIFHLLANIFVGVLYTPYLVSTMGIAAYGVVPLALVINQYINVISLSLVNALTRFYSIEYRKNNIEKASRYFSTSIVVGIIFTIIFYPILYVSINYIDSFFEIPPDLLDDAIWLFRLTVASFFISIISNCVNTTLFADNLLNYVNYLKITRQTSKMLVNIVLFYFLDISIIYVGVANLVSELLVLLISLIFYQKTKPAGVHFGLRLYNEKFLFTMLAMIAWVLMQRFSDTFLYKIDSVLMNLYFGIKMTGIIGAISEFGSYVTSITTVLSSLMGPLLLIAYSKRNYKDYRRITVEGAYIIGLFTGLLCGMLSGSATTLLTLWLGKSLSGYGSWMIIKLIVIPYTTAGALFANSYLYANRNKYPALVSLCLAILNILINVFVLTWVNSVELFLTICLLFVVLQGLIMNVLFYNSLYKGELKRIALLTLKYTLYMFCIFSLMSILLYIFEVQSLESLMFIYCIVFIIGVAILDGMFLSKEQRMLVFEIAPVYQKIRKIIQRHR